MFYTKLETVFGPMFLTASQDALTGAYFVGQKYFPELASAGTAAPEHQVLQLAVSQLLEYTNGKRARFELPVEPAGTAFQRTVWQALLNVPTGITSQYGHIAREIGAPAASRAVGAAIGRNPISIIIPCHRIVGANGSLTGYAGGIDRKQALLRFEAQTYGP